MQIYDQLQGTGLSETCDWSKEGRKFAHFSGFVWVIEFVPENKGTCVNLKFCKDCKTSYLSNPQITLKTYKRQHYLDLEL
uniref:Uncharacterized protein n=1 Tax=Pararge aegeria TaxID=116150 RepID=S4PRG5_9NEOP